MKSLLILATIFTAAVQASSAHGHGHQVAHHARDVAHAHNLPIHTRATEEEPYELTEEDYAPFIKENDDDEEDWEDFADHTVGLMMERDVTPAELSSLHKRAAEVGHHRDIERSTVELEIDERGDIKFPKSWAEVRRLVKRVGKTFKANITWYTAHDLLNPACIPQGGYTPTDKSLISAVTQVWKEKPACGQYLKLRAKNSKKTVIVRVIDACAGCPKNVPHVDLTKKAFSSLYNLNVGFVEGIQMKKVSAPFAKYSKSNIALFGPENL